MLGPSRIGALVLLTSALSTAQTARTLQGRWSASTMRTSYTADPWSEACGPRPSANSDPGGVVTVTERGTEITISGLGRSFGSNSCWESIPGGVIVSHTVSQRAWRTVCQSPTGDPRRSAITTSMTATDDRIDLIETGQFEFTIGEANCHAVLRRSRSFSLVERDGETRLAPGEQAPPSPNAAAPAKAHVDESGLTRAAADCREPGPAMRIEVSPARKLLRAGEEFLFRVRVLDKLGCTVDRQVTWKVLTPSSDIELSPAGKLKVKPNAGEAQLQLQVSIQAQSLVVIVDIVSEARYKELLQVGSFNAQGETGEPAATTLVSSTVGAKTATGVSEAANRRIIFIWTIGALAVGLGIGALVLALGRRKTKNGGSPQRAASDYPAPGAHAAVLHPNVDRSSPRPSQSLICPTCHEEYPFDRKFCEVDGNRLVPIPSEVTIAGAEGGICPVCRHGFDPGLTRCPVHDEELVPAAVLPPSPTTPVSVGRRICPLCGTLYGPDTQFCGNDGAALVPIN